MVLWALKVSDAQDTVHPSYFLKADSAGELWALIPTPDKTGSLTGCGFCPVSFRGMIPWLRTEEPLWDLEECGHAPVLCVPSVMEMVIRVTKGMEVRLLGGFWAMGLGAKEPCFGL